MDPTRATSIAGPSSRGLYGDQSRRRPALLHRAQSGPILRHRSVTSPVLETRGGYHTSADMSHIISSEEDWSLFGDLFMSSAEPSEAFGSAHSPSSVAGATSGPDAISPISPILSEHSEPPHHSDLSTSSNSFSISSDPSSRPASPSETIRPPDSKVSQPHTLSNGFTSSFTPAPLPPPQAPPTKSILKLPQLTTLQRNILKCSVAYFIGSLFTFVPYLSGFLSDIVPFGSNEGPSPTGHMVATVAVYFNPAKTAGGMAEADVFCLFAAAFSALVSISSMAMYKYLDEKEGWEWLADSTAFVWIATGMTLLAWLKMYVAKPTFNAACSMASIILFVVVVKEGGFETMLHVSFIVLIGSIISNLVCFILWPQSATDNLQADMTKTLNSFSTLLNMLTRTFLLEEDLHPQHSKLLSVVSAHQSSFTSLKKNLDEARSEYILDSRIRNTSESYGEAVDSLNRLAQHLASLRSGVGLQFELSKAKRRGELEVREGVGGAKEYHVRASSRESVGESAQNPEDLAATAAMYGDLVQEVGPSMKALVNTCTNSLNLMTTAFRNSRSPHHLSALPEQTMKFATLAEQDVRHALSTFDKASNQALVRLYRGENASSGSDKEGIEPSKENESVFLFYFFIFTLQEFSLDLLGLLDIMATINDVERAIAMQNSRFGWLWDAFSCCLRRRRASADIGIRSKRTLRRTVSRVIPLEPRHKATSLFPPTQPHAPNTVQTPPRATLSFWGRVQQSIWTLTSRLRQADISYSLKTGLGVAILAAPAFIDRTRPVFLEYRGEWALISFFVVMSPTIGATNFLAVHRILGTLLGAFTAVVAYTLFPDRPLPLAIFGFFFSIPCFYYIVSKPKYATSARFVLLAYNLTCLFRFNIRDQPQSVITIAFHRSTAVTAGVLGALVVSRWWWPSEARRELGKGLSDLCLNISWLYVSLIKTYILTSPTAPDRNPNNAGDDDAVGGSHSSSRESLLSQPARSHLKSSIKEFMSMELHLQRKLLELQELLAQTQNEPRLKGPFPVKLYRSILRSLQTILNDLHSMRCVTTREEWHTSVYHDFIVPVHRERREMVGNVLLYFSTLSSSFKLKAPLPPYLPPAEQARQRLVEAIRNLDIVKRRDVKGSRQLLFFAYALMMRGVISELEFLGESLQEAFGVIGGGHEEFERLFRDPEEGFIDGVDPHSAEGREGWY